MSTNHKKSSDSSVIEILVVDDHPAIHQALRTVINSEDDMRVAGGVRSREEALEFIDKSPPLLAIVDISLENSYGVRLVREIADRSSDVRILVYSMYDEHLFARRAIAAGALGYVMKRRPASEVVTAVRTILDGDVYLSKEVTSSLLDSLASDTQSSERSKLDDLSSQELAVFHLLGEGYTLAEISEQLGQKRRTIRSTRRQIRKKLGLETTGDLIEEAIRWFFHESNEPKGAARLAS